MEREFKRQGQVYFLHDRVATMGLIKKRIEHFVPDAKVGIIHGRLTEKELLSVITKLENQEINTLLATTIIENGIDFPNVNTLIVANATRLGLSQAHQIRGRIGRSEKEAYAYFLYREKNAGISNRNYR